jgi:hypothetical protein
MMARPTKLSPAVLEKVCEGVRLGMSYERASARVGISDATLRNWVKRDEEGVRAYAGVVEALQKARADGETRLLARIVKAAEEDWKAAAWILERRHPESYARIERREVSGPNGDPMKLEVSSWADLVRQATEGAE